MDKIAQLKAFLEEQPDNNFLWHALALEYIKNNKIEEAIQCFEKNLYLNKNYVATYYHYGQLLEKLAKINESLDLYEKGMAIAKQINDNHSFRELYSVYELLKF
jgi:tetratricopeptide (TPR) repeat protein